MRARRFGLLAILVAGALAIAGAQAPPPPQAPLTGTGLIVGRVVEADGTRPVAGAVVTLSMASAAGASPTIPGAVAIGSPATQPGGFQQQRVLTDGTGRFLFRDLPAGRFDFSVTAAGYLAGGGYGQRRPSGGSQSFELTDSEKVRDVTLRLWRPAVISGMVTDQTGEPVVNASLRVFRRQWTAGTGMFTLSGATLSTDDRGFYRAANLTPGDYIVGIPSTARTTPQSVLEAYQQGLSGGSGSISSLLTSSGAGIPTTEGRRIDDLVLSFSSLLGSSGSLLPPPTTGRQLVYPTVFYPSASTAAQATVITLQSGQERPGVDLQLKLVPSYRISGRVLGPQGGVPNIGVRLLVAGSEGLVSENGIETAVGVTDESGAFTMLGVPAASYTLKVSRVPTATNPTSTSTMIMVDTPGGGSMGMGTSIGPGGLTPPPPPISQEPTLSGSAAVVVADADVATLTVTLQNGPRVRGRLEFEGSNTKPTPDQIIRAVMTFESADGRTPISQLRGLFDRDGQFTSNGLMPGRYFLRVSGPGLVGWYLKSADLNGRDVSDEPLIIDSTDIGPVVVTFTDQPTQLKGTVRDAAGAGDRNATVMVFPTDRSRWAQNGVNPRSQRMVRASPAGVYTVAGLPAGQYFVAAIDDQATSSWPDPRYMETLVRTAITVTIGQGETKTQDLKTSPSR